MDINELVEVDPEKMGGVPVFTGTRVPIKHMFEYLEGGDSLEEFLDQFPTKARAGNRSARVIAKEASSRL